MSVADTHALLEQFKQSFFAEPTKVDECLGMLPKLKIAVAKFPSLHPLCTHEISPQELMLARETYELATLLSVKAQDVASFERHLAKAKTLYNDYNTIHSHGQSVSMPKSERQNLILGLNLLFLLSQNRMAEFHTEMELIPLEMHSTIFIEHPVRLEQYLMEGSYNKVVAAQREVPADSYHFFMGILVETVRDEIADCCERAYEQLDLTDAQKMLMCESPEQLAEYIAVRDTERGWSVHGSTLTFDSLGGDSSSAVLSEQLIVRSLEYAKELERIV